MGERPLAESCGGPVWHITLFNAAYPKSHKRIRFPTGFILFLTLLASSYHTIHRHPPKKPKATRKEKESEFYSIFFSLRSFLRFLPVFFKINSLFDSLFTVLDCQCPWSAKLWIRFFSSFRSFQTLEWKQINKKIGKKEKQKLKKKVIFLSF